MKLRCGRVMINIMQRNSHCQNIKSRGKTVTNKIRGEIMNPKNNKARNQTILRFSVSVKYFYNEDISFVTHVFVNIRIIRK